MDGWKRGKPYAMVVCPIYQLPIKSSQIYEQASSRNVCIFTYSHLGALLSVCDRLQSNQSEQFLQQIFQCVSLMNPSKSATNYWNVLNKTIFGFSSIVEDFWRAEKIATIESIAIAKEHALMHLTKEREKIMKMTHAEALKELIKVHKIDSKIAVIKSVLPNKILEMR